MNNMKNQKGIFLISSYLVLSLLGTFSTYVFLKNASVYWNSERTRNRIAAFHLAEAGVDQAIVRLRNDLTYTGQGYTPYGAGGYDIQVDTPDPLLNPRLRRITTIGYTPNNSTNSYAFSRRQIVTHVQFSPAASGTYAVFSNTSIQISGNVRLDSYDSRLGSYNSQPQRANGDLGTNTILRGMVALSGNVTVRGDVIVGPAGNPSSVIRTSGNVVIEGSRTAASSLKVLDPVVVPAGCLNQGSLTVNGNNTVTLPSGTYCYSSVSISGNGQVNFTGAATVYVTGSVNVSGNGFGTSSNLPTNLKINVAGVQSVSLSGNGNLYGVIYAPLSGVSLTGNGQMFGSVTGNTIQESGNGQVHYDEALNQNSGSGATNQSQVLAWTESG